MAMAAARDRTDGIWPQRRPVTLPGPQGNLAQTDRGGPAAGLQISGCRQVVHSQPPSLPAAKCPRQTLPDPRMQDRRDGYPRSQRVTVPTTAQHPMARPSVSVMLKDRETGSRSVTHSWNLVTSKPPIAGLLRPGQCCRQLPPWCPPPGFGNAGTSARGHQDMQQRHDTVQRFVITHHVYHCQKLSEDCCQRPRAPRGTSTGCRCICFVIAMHSGSLGRCRRDGPWAGGPGRVWAAS